MEALMILGIIAFALWKLGQKKDYEKGLAPPPSKEEKALEDIWRKVRNRAPMSSPAPDPSPRGYAFDYNLEILSAEEIEAMSNNGASVYLGHYRLYPSS
jgi:hypothetical protein